VFSADDPRLRGAGEAGAEPRPSTTLSRAARDVDLDLYGRLPATAREARRIAADLPQARTLLAFGFDARRELVLSGRLQDYRILHFATHGLLDRSHPELSGLLLSRFDAAGRPVDGYVRLADIHRLRLRADLAVLSACETGLGREYRGEGLLSLAHGFMEAGVPRLVVSMWRVGDEDTAQLMERFYERLIGTSYRSVPDALRQAQMWMLDHEEWSSPHQWAGFIFLGDPRAVALDDSIEKAETAGGGGTPDEPPDDPTPGGGHGPGIPDGPAYWNPETTMDTAG
jgi:CHAT domain-containing protein